MPLGGTPIEEYVLQAIEARLAAVNGPPTYNFAIRKVVDFEAWDDDLLVYPAAMVLSLTTDEDDSLFTDRQTITMNFQVVAIMNAWTNARLDCGRLVADIKQSLLSDVTLGGYARDVHITRTERFQYDVEGGGRAGASLFGNVQFRHIRGDPYQQG